MQQVDRRLVFKTFAAAGAAAVAEGHGRGAQRGRPPPPDAVGLLYDTTRCIGCKACVVACRRGQRHEPDTGNSPGGIWDTPDRPQRRHEERHQALQERGRRRSGRSSRRSACTASTRRARRLHARRAQEGASTAIVTYDAELLHRLPLLPDGLPVQRPEVRVGQQPAPKHRQVRALPPSRPGRGLAKSGVQPHRRPRSGCAEVCPRQAVIFGKRDELLAEAKRRMAENPGRYVAEGLRRDRRRRHAVPLPLARAVRQARPADARRRAGARRRSRRSSTASTRASSRRSRSTVSWAAAICRNRKKPAPAGGSGEKGAPS